LPPGSLDRGHAHPEGGGGPNTAKFISSSTWNVAPVPDESLRAYNTNIYLTQ
jgi:hypothetical protein